MLTINSIQNTIYFDLLNRIPEGIHVFYRPSSNRFEYHYNDRSVDDELIMTPCLYEMEYAVRKEFYSSLSEAEYDLVRRYPFRKGFFDYLKEIGLRDTYNEVESIVALKIVKAWLEEHHINISRGYDIDASYI